MREGQLWWFTFILLVAVIGGVVMVHGQPDFGMYAPKNVVGSMADNAELAVRLNSIVSYDRRGDVAFLDDFESPVLKWTVTVAGAEYGRLDSENVRSGAQALKIHTRAAAGWGPYAVYGLAMLGDRRLGSEISFYTSAATLYLGMIIRYYDGTLQHYGMLEYDFVLGELSIWDPVAGQVIIATGITLPTGKFAFTQMKLVVDFDNDKYVRAILGHTEYDISAYDCITAGSGFPVQDNIWLWVANDVTATPADIWLDDFILTQNEP